MTRWAPSAQAEGAARAGSNAHEVKGTSDDHGLRDKLLILYKRKPFQATTHGRHREGKNNSKGKTLYNVFSGANEVYLVHSHERDEEGDELWLASSSSQMCPVHHISKGLTVAVSKARGHPARSSSSSPQDRPLDPS